MTDLLDQLKAALADRYSIERELGRGGMAVVYLALDQKLNREAHSGCTASRQSLTAPLAFRRSCDACGRPSRAPELSLTILRFFGRWPPRPRRLTDAAV